MAMASKTFTVGLRILGSKPKVLLGGTCGTSKVSVAYITGRASRTEPVEKVKPWPYRERGYTNLHAYWDGTLKRIDENSKVIVIEGPPAIGKTALAKAVAEELEMKYFPMVTTESYFVNEYGFDERQLNKDLPPRLHSYDENDFIKNPKSPKVILLQTILWVQKFKQYIDALAHVLNTGQGVVLDRCVYSQTVFTDTLLEMGYLNKTERAVYQKIIDRGLPELMKPHLVVYLDAPVSTVEANLKNRGRGEEKVWNREMLERLEHNYKHSYLKTISEHAELLAYDWTTPGEAEVVVEDIERIDFDRFDIHDPKMEDWRLKEEWDWSEKRWQFTDTVQTTILVNKILSTPGVQKVPALIITGEEQEQYDQVWENAPGNKYAAGYNADLGDTGFLFKTKPKARVWKETNTAAT